MKSIVWYVLISALLVSGCVRKTEQTGTTKSATSNAVYSNEEINSFLTATLRHFRRAE